MHARVLGNNRTYCLHNQQHTGTYVVPLKQKRIDDEK